MKVLLVNNNFYITGGVEVFFLEVGRVLESRGHDVGYFSAQDARNNPSPWSVYFPPAVDYRQGSLLKRIAQFGRMLYSRTAKNNMNKLLKSFKPDIVHVFSIHIKITLSILEACREYGVPVVISCNEYKHICPNYKLFHHSRLCEECKGGGFYRAAMNRCCHGSTVYSVASTVEAYVHKWSNIYRENVHTFLFASEFMAKKTEEFWGAGSFRWRMLRNPFDSCKYPLHEGYNDYLLYFGRLIDEKGVNILIRAMQYVPEAKLKIVGDGPQESELRDLSNSLGLTNVEFLGPKWGEEIDNLLANCRFTVVPSLWHENFPYVILQSFAMGKPVVGSNRGGIPELVRHRERGLVYEANNPSSLAEAIAQMWTAPSLTLEMGKRAKEFADSEFNDDRFYANIIEIYREVLS